MEPSEFDIKKYLKLIDKKKRLFIGAALAIMTAVTLVSYLLPKQYEATSTVFIERNVIDSLVKGLAITPSMEDRIKVLAYTMGSRNLLLKVIDDLGLGVNKGDQAAVDKLIRDFQKNTEITMKDKSDLFIVAYKSGDPKLARDYVNALVRRYIEENIAEKREEAYGANRFLAEQIKFFKEKLDKSDEEIIKFRKEKGIFVALDDRKIVEEIKDAQLELDEIRIKKRELEGKRTMILKQMKEEKPNAAGLLGKGGSIDDRLLALQKRLADLLMVYTPGYPEVVRIKSEIEMLKGQIAGGSASRELLSGLESGETDADLSLLNPLYQQLREELSKTGLELAALNAKEDQIRRLVESKKTYLKSMPAEKKTLTDLEMQRATNKNIYEELIGRLGQSEVSRQMEIQDKSSTFRIVDPAVLPLKPVSPNRIKIILMGILGGLAGGFGLVVLLDYMDRSVRTVDVLKNMGLPVLAVIPSIQNPDELEEKKRRDMLLYKFTGAYMMCILTVFVMELMGLTYIDDAISTIVHLPSYLMDLNDAVKRIF
ncbi:MAG: XrtA system polysaccharide chain length determinant [Nitrospirota bacterium]